MKERPILMSGPLVVKTIRGEKTQTRRVVKGTPLEWLKPEGFSPEFVANPENHLCPYGQTGDRLWVRETWAPHADEEQTFANYDIKTRGIGGPCSIEEGHVRPEIFYRADGGDPFINNWRPSIHMPRWASRLTLEVTGVRVERLQDISEEDARAEGVEPSEDEDQPWCCYAPACERDGGCAGVSSARRSFETLWDSINADRASWASNPWCWVVQFSVAEVRR